MVDARYIAGVMACVLVVCSLYALRRTGSDTGYEMTVVTRTALYDGKYGVEAMDMLAKFRSELFKKTMAWQSQHNTSYVSTGQQVNFDAFKTYLPCPPGRPLTVYTEEISKQNKDAPKPLCSVVNLEPPCIIYSLGSNNDYSFELEMLKTTQCEVHTFDCTVQGSKQHPQRHTYHQVCLGAAPKNHKQGNQFKHLQTVMKELGHTKVDLLKMDIEGFEYDVLQDWSETDPNLPDQLALELHYHSPYPPYDRPDIKTVTRIPEMALLFAHLANMGYGIVGYEPNNPECSEFGLLRVESVQRVAINIPGALLGGRQEHDQRRRQQRRLK